MTRASSGKQLSGAALTVLCATILVSVMSASMTTVALPDLQRDFDVGADTLTWVVTAYLITFATGTVIYGRLADMVGTKPMYVFGLLLFTAASLGVALAPTFWLAVAARAVQGFGGTAIPALSMATIVKTTPAAVRGRSMGATVLAVGVGFGLGPIVGGTLTEFASWRAPFLATGVSAAVLLPISLLLVPSVPGDRRKRFDYAGAMMLGLGVTGVIVALNRLPRRPDDLLGLAGAGVALVFLAALRWRVRNSPEPFLDPRIVENRRFLALSGVGAATQGSHFAVIVMIPLLLAEYHGLSIIRIGVHLLPGALAIAVFGMLGGVLTGKLGTALLLKTGSVVLLIGAVAFHLFGVASEPWTISLLYVVVAAGYAMINASVITAATAELPEDLSGLGVGVFNLLFFLGGAISVAIAGAILRGRDGVAEALDPFARTGAAEFSDAMLVVVAYAAFALTLTIATHWRARAVLQPAEAER